MESVTVSKQQGRAIIGAYVAVVLCAAAVFYVQEQTISALREQSLTNCAAIRTISTYEYGLATTSRELFKPTDKALLTIRQHDDQDFLSSMGVVLQAAHCDKLRT